MKKNFALIGAGGYVAGRHLKAIKETGNRLVCALDKNDSVGILDSYFPDASFFIEYERFDRYVDKLRRDPEKKLDYVSICTPNYLHDSQIRFALRNEAHAICEKPLVLNPWNMEALARYERELGFRIYTILQLRLHPDIIALKKRIAAGPGKRIYDIDMNYITPRGRWYFTSWKSDIAKSGGIATNIGVHFFDMLSWIFGEVEESIVHVHQHDKAAGFLRLKNARVRWFLSIDYQDIPEEMKATGSRTYRSLNLNGEEVDFSEGFNDLHTVSYTEIMDGRGFGVDDAMRSIEITYQIRNSRPAGLTGDYNPILRTINLGGKDVNYGYQPFNFDC